MALQPALQLVTRVLNTNHPYWSPHFDVLNRKPIDKDRKSRYAKNELLVSIWEHLANPHMPTHANFLRSQGFEPSTAANQYFHQRFELDIVSRTHAKGDYSRTPVWGCTQIWDPPSHFNPSTTKIRSTISADMMWQLLVPTYTQAEKASVSLMIAATILHEMAVSTFLTCLEEKEVVSFPPSSSSPSCFWLFFRRKGKKEKKKRSVSPV